GRELGRAQVHGDYRRIVRSGKLRDVRARVRATPAVDVAAGADYRDGRATGRIGAHHRQARSAGARRQAALRRRGTRYPTADPGKIRARGLALLLHGAAVGRWDSRSGRYPRRARARVVDGVQRADTRGTVRGVSHVRLIVKRSRTVNAETVGHEIPSSL